MEWILRKATAADRQRIEELFVEMLQTIFQKTDVQGYAPGDLDRFFGGEDWICVAEVKGSVMAFLSMEVHREQVDYVYLDDFSVSAAYRGAGVGTQMMAEAEKFAWDIGFSNIVLHVEKSNSSARRLYERSGYELLNDEGNRISMIKRIS